MINYLWVALEKFGLVFIRLIGTIILARLLIPSDFGIYSMAAIVISFSGVLVDSGLVGSLIRKESVSEEDYSTAFIVNFMVSLILYCVLYLSSGNISAFYNSPELENVIKITSLVIIIRSLSLVQLAKLNRELKFKIQAKVYLFSAIISILIALSAAVYGFGYWSLVLQTLTEATLSTIFLCMRSNYVPKKRFSKNSLVDLYGFGIKLMLSSLIQTAYENVVGIILGKSYGQTTLGYYSQANKLNSVFISTSRTVLDKAAYPALSKSISNKKNLLNQTSLMIRNSTSVCFLLITIIFVSSEQLIKLLLGAHWSESITILRIICLSGYGMIVESSIRTVFKAQGLASLILKLEFYKRTLGVFFLILASNSSIEAILYTYVTISICSALVNMIMLSKYVGFSLYDQVKDILPAFVSIMTSIFILYEFYDVSNHVIWLILIVNIVIVTSTYCLTLAATRFNDAKKLFNFLSNSK